MNRHMKALRDEARKFKSRRGRIVIPLGVVLGGFAAALATEIALTGVGSAWLVAIPFAIAAALAYHGQRGLMRRVYADAVPVIEAEGLVPEGWRWDKRREKAAIDYERRSGVKSLAGVAGMFGLAVFGIALAHHGLDVVWGGQPMGDQGWADVAFLAISFLLACWGAWRLLLGMLGSLGQASQSAASQIANAASGRTDPMGRAVSAHIGAVAKNTAWIWGHDPKTEEGSRALREIGGILAFWSKNERAGGRR